MANTIVSLNNYRDQFGQPLTTGTVDFYVDATINGILTIWQLTEKDIDLAQYLSAVQNNDAVAYLQALTSIQTSLDANTAAYLAAAQNQVPLATASAAKQALYIASHKIWETPIMIALFKMDDVIRSGSFVDAATGLQTARDALQAGQTAITNLPTAYVNLWNNERALQGVTGAISSMTIAQCRELEKTMRSWLNSRLVMSRYANTRG